MNGFQEDAWRSSMLRPGVFRLHVSSDPQRGMGVPHRRPSGSAAQRARFIAALRRVGEVELAAAAAGIAPPVVYAWAEQRPTFARKWRRAGAGHLSAVHSALAERL